MTYHNEQHMIYECTVLDNRDCSTFLAAQTAREFVVVISCVVNIQKRIIDTKDDRNGIRRLYIAYLRVTRMNFSAV